MRNKVFMCYSHKDAASKEDLRRHLSFFEKKGLLEAWDDTKIGTGDEWRKEIQKAINSSAVVILLISNDFLISDFIQGVEVPSILVKPDVKVYPVIVLPCNWKEEPWLENLQARPKGEKTLSDLKNKRGQYERELSSIAKEIQEILDVHGGKDSKSRSPKPAHGEGIGGTELEHYAQQLTAEINSDLVREITKKKYYEDFCITPMVVPVDSRGEHTIPVGVRGLSRERHSLIIGEPGSGKTTALRDLALHLLGEIPRRTIPILLSLAAFKADKQSFEVFIDGKVSNLGCQSFAELSRARNIEIILLLDGWDEIQDEKGRTAVIEFLQDKGCRFILTSRPECERYDRHCDRYEMQPLAGERVLEFIQRRFPGRKSAEDLYKRILGDPAMEWLARNPLTLSIMTIVYGPENGEEGNVGNISKTGLYEEAFRAIMNQYHRRLKSGRDWQGGHEKEKKREEEKKIEKLLQSLAFKKMEMGGGRFFYDRRIIGVGFRNLRSGATGSGGPLERGVWYYT